MRIVSQLRLLELLLLLLVILRPDASRPLAESDRPHLHTVRLSHELVEVRTCERIATVRRGLEPLEVIPAVDVDLLGAPIEMCLDISVLVVRYLDRDCITRGDPQLVPTWTRYGRARCSSERIPIAGRRRTADSLLLAVLHTLTMSITDN